MCGKVIDPQWVSIVYILVFSSMYTLFSLGLQTQYNLLMCNLIIVFKTLLTVHHSNRYVVKLPTAVDKCVLKGRTVRTVAPSFAIRELVHRVALTSNVLAAVAGHLGLSPVLRPSLLTVKLSAAAPSTVDFIRAPQCAIRDPARHVPTSFTNVCDIFFSHF